MGSEGLEANADVGMAGRTALQDLGGNLAGHIDRDRKTEARPRCLADCGVDADHLAAIVDQRAAAVAWIDGGVGLDVGHPLALTHRIGALDGTDDPGGHRVVQAEGVTDGDRHFAWAHPGGIPQGGHRQFRGHHLDHGHIGEGVTAEHLAVEAAAIGQGHGHLAGPLHHMGIGQQHPIRAGDEARSLALLLLNRGAPPK